MDEGVTNDTGTEDAGSVATTNTGSREFHGRTDPVDPMARAKVPPPEGVPEKFWDGEKGEVRTDALLKSYAELEKARGQKAEEDVEEASEGAEEGADEAEEETTEDAEEGAEEGSDEGSEGEEEGSDEDGEEGDEPSAAEKAVADAEQAFAKDGKLSDENYSALEEAGYSRQYVDLYLAGVKATQAALTQSAKEAAGSMEDLEAAKLWAAENWSEKQIAAYDGQVNDVETVKMAVTGLMADYRAANPGEGKLQDKTSGMTRGSVYKSMEEYDADLAAAGTSREKRREAVEKYRRSLKAKTIKPTRAQPFGR